MDTDSFINDFERQCEASYSALLEAVPEGSLIPVIAAATQLVSEMLNHLVDAGADRDVLVNNVIKHVKAEVYGESESLH